MARTLLCAVLMAGIFGAAAAAGPVRKSGLAVGPVMTGETGEEVGLRGGFDSGLLLVALERFDDELHQRTRAEVALRIPIRLTRRLTLAPQLGLLPIDYAYYDGGDRWLGMSASATTRLDLFIYGPLSLVAEPLRVELRFAEITIPALPRAMPEIERPMTWEARAFVGLRLGW